jgi:hypothetical protein
METEVIIPINEDDIEMFDRLMEGHINDIQWLFTSNSGEDVLCKFVKEEDNNGTR